MYIGIYIYIYVCLYTPAVANLIFKIEILSKIYTRKHM